MWASESLEYKVTTISAFEGEKRWEKGFGERRRGAKLSKDVDHGAL
jgi:hypothetical protein